MRSTLLIFLGILLTTSTFSQEWIFDELGPSSFPEVSIAPTYSSTMDIADANGDGNMDFLITGNQGDGTDLTTLYINDGIGGFYPSGNSVFTNVKNGACAFADIDGDGDQDILITGIFNGNTGIAEIYKNDGFGNYTMTNQPSLAGSWLSSVAFADIDGDNDQDLVISGLNNSLVAHTTLYTNDGTGSFSQVSGTPLVGLKSGEIAFADIDGDDDQDLFITGSDDASVKTSMVYLNNGSGVFNSIQNTPYPGVDQSSVHFTDIDGDNDMDLFLGGVNDNLETILQLYKNDGTGYFDIVLNTPFNGLAAGDLTSGDIDNDGDQDVFLSGKNVNGSKVTQIYLNGGTGDYNLLGFTPFVGSQWGAVGLINVDNDDDLDIIYNGFSTTGGSQAIVKLFETNICFPAATVQTVTSCESYTWINLTTYTSSNNTATHTLQTEMGCDSVVTLNLTILDRSNAVDQITACDEYTWLDGNTYTASNSTATHVMTNAVGCDSIITLDLEIIESSNVTFDEITTCGTHIVDEVTTCDSYVWVDGNTYTSTNNTATYLFNTPNSQGCDSMLLLNLTIPEIATTITEENNTLTVEEADASSYQWIDCNTGLAIPGETEQQYTPIVPGVYSVQITKEDCSDISECFDMFILNTQDEFLTQNIDIFPNPTNGQFTIQPNGVSEDLFIKIINTLGQEIKNLQAPNGTSLEIPFDSPAGVYFIQVTSETGKQAVFQIVKS